jgi:hypothetical protein
MLDSLICNDWMRGLKASHSPKKYERIARPVKLNRVDGMLADHSP